MRFKDDDDSYSKTIYESICDISTGNKNTQDKIDNGIYPFYVRSNTIERINNYTFDGEAILTAGDGVGVGKVFHYVKGKIGVHQRVYLLSNFKCCAKYLFYHFSSRFYDRVKIMSAKNSVDSVRYDMIAKMKIYLPAKTQIQEKVANFFSLLDQRIDTQSKIIEDLKLFKKGIWNYIYSTKSDKWRKVKLADILFERKDYATKEDEYIHVTLSKDGIFAKTDRYNRDFLVTNDEKKYKVTHLNDICYNPANLKFGVICMNKFGDAIFSPIYITYIVNSNHIPSFIELILTDTRFINYIRKYEQGTVYERMSVNPEDFLKGEILVPCKNEQLKITELFEILNSYLKKEKDILELYKKQKAYLLKNMFI